MKHTLYRWLSRLPLTRKIAAGQFAILGLFMIVVLSSLVALWHSRGAADAVARDYEASILIRTAQADLVDMNGLVRGIILNPVDFLVDVYDLTSNRFDKTFAEFQTYITDDAEISRLSDELSKAVNILRSDYYGRQITLARAGETDMAATIETSGESWPYLETVLVNTGKIIDMQKARQETRLAAMYRAFFIQQMIVVIGALLAVAVAVWVIRLSGREITRPLQDMITSIQKLAGGDTNAAIPHASRADELGDMADALTIFKSAIVEKEALTRNQLLQAEKDREQDAANQRIERERLEQEKQAAAAKASKAAEQADLVSHFEDQMQSGVKILYTTAETLTQSAMKMSETAHQSAGNAENAHTITEDMAASSKRMNDELGAFTRALSELLDAFKTATNMARDASDATTTGTQAVDDLTNASVRIETVVRLINDIAEQTNLLALNATIEAARAGDAGKGFAVVASEVKTLATQTANATREITSQINEMQSVSKGVSEAMTVSNAKISELDSLLQDAAQQLSRQERATEDLSHIAATVLDGAANVAATMAALRTEASATLTAASDVTSGTEKVLATGNNIHSDVQAFRSNLKAFTDKDTAGAPSDARVSLRAV